MRKTLLIITGIALFAAGQGFGYSGPIGVAALQRIDLLPQIKIGMRSLQMSSHERTNGNADGSQYLRDWVVSPGDTEQVLFDAVGPGCLYTIWSTISTTPITMPNGYQEWIEIFPKNMKFYFDGETTPRINLPYDSIFTGTHAPFLSPLVANYAADGSGNVCYVPMMFKRSLTITGVRTYFHFDYAAFDNADNVTTFTGTENLDTVVQQWQNRGYNHDPKSTTGNQVVSGTATIANAQSQTIGSLTGPGEIESIRLIMSSAAYPIMGQTWIDIAWDGESTPSVHAPLGEFFGSGCSVSGGPLGAARSLLFGVNGTSTNDSCYCYFPMPFNGSASVRINNASGTSVSNLKYEIQYRTLAASQNNVGYFHAWHNAENPTVAGFDYPFLRAVGQGHFVGVSHVLQINTPEGNERFRIDASSTSAWIGTGTEDYYNHGWGLSGNVKLPMDGDGGASPQQTAYRLHLSDCVPFNDTAQFGIQIGGSNAGMEQNVYSSTAFYYLKPQKGMQCTDSVDVGNTASETSHSYTNNGQTWSGSHTYQFDAQDGPTLVNVTDDGRACTGYSQFTVAINSNNAGVILRRRSDIHAGQQKGLVLVNGDTAGYWYTPDLPATLAGAAYPPVTSSFLWTETEFQIPPSMSAGKTSLQIRLNVAPGSPSWTEYRYWAFSIGSGSATPIAGKNGLATTTAMQAEPKCTLAGKNTIRFSGTGIGGATIRIFTLQGATVAVLHGATGCTTLDWSSQAGNRSRMNAGTYLYQIKPITGSVAIGKFSLLK